MSISIGGINLFRQGLDSEYRITILELVLERIILKSPGIVTPEEIAEAKEAALILLKAKYPDAGIQAKEGEDGKK